MAKEPERTLAKSDWPDLVRTIRARTPARLLAGRVGAAYHTETQLELWEAHADARDSVRAELDLENTFEAAFIREWALFDAYTDAADKNEYLLRPDLGRRFSAASRTEILQRCSSGNDLQIAVGDGLSVAAIRAQVPRLLPLLHKESRARGWSTGQTFVIHHCRVGILNEVGELLNPTVAVLLIGERPGLATAESLSAYMAYRPCQHHSDANRNLISNIHSRGLSTSDAVIRILNLAARMMTAQVSGSTLREELAALAGVSVGSIAVSGVEQSIPAGHRMQGSESR
jgi:ethanolamine ammonia-lyase small subunit